LTTLLRGAEAADTALRRAHAQIHHHPPHFPGFRARLTVIDDGRSSEGSMSAPTGGPVRVTLPDDAPGRDWAVEELRSMVVHRSPRSYDDFDGRWVKRFAEGTEDSLEPVIVMDDPMDSSYKLRDGRIAQITRCDGGTRFTISILDERRAAAGGVVAAQFLVSWWAPDSGRLVRAAAYRDDHIESGGLLLPSSRTVVSTDDDGVVMRRLELRDHAVAVVEVSS
jgi:hypothetical protein